MLGKKKFSRQSGKSSSQQRNAPYFIITHIFTTLTFYLHTLLRQTGSRLIASILLFRNTCEN
jgi:hypothetical protein